MTIYHLTRKTGSKKMTIAMYLPANDDCIASAEDVFKYNGIDTRPCMIEDETVCNQKIWKGYTEECPVYYHDKPTREYLANVGYAERDRLFRDYQRGEMTEEEYIQACDKSYKQQDQQTATQPADAITEWVNKYPTEEAQREATRAAKQAAANPITYPMIEGEGAPQYTFALDTTTEPVQLALL